MISTAKVRIAKPSSDLLLSKKFYQDGLGLSLLSEFENHDGFDGVILGIPNSCVHFEFTFCRHHKIIPRPTPEDLFVFYIEDSSAWASCVYRLESIGVSPVPSYNRYWDKDGKTFEDYDGYRVVVLNAGWNK